MRTPVYFDSVAELLASSRTVAVGKYIECNEELVRYKVAAANATDHHVTTASGMKLYVLPGVNGFNIRAFGAVGDDTTNDTAAIQAAMNARYNGVLRSIYVPVGTYRVNMNGWKQAAALSWSIPNDERLFGASVVGENQLKSIIKFYGDGDGLVISGTSTSQLVYGLKIEDLQLRGASDGSLQRLLRLRFMPWQSTINRLSISLFQSLGTEHTVTNIQRALTTGTELVDSETLGWTTFDGIATTSAAHDIEVGDWVRVDNIAHADAVYGDFNFEGFYRVRAVTDTTVTYENEGPAVSSRAVTSGTIQKVCWGFEVEHCWNLCVQALSLDFSNTKSAFGMLLINGNQTQFRDVFTVGQGTTNQNNTCQILCEGCEGSRVDFTQIGARTHYGLVYEAGLESNRGLQHSMGPFIASGNVEGPNIGWHIRRRAATQLLNRYRVQNVTINSSTFAGGGPNAHVGVRPMRIGAWFRGASKCRLERFWVGLSGSLATVYPAATRARDASDVCTITTQSTHNLRVGQWVIGNEFSGDAATGFEDSGSFNGAAKVTRAIAGTVQFVRTGPTVEEIADTDGEIIGGPMGFIIEPDCEDIEIPRIGYGNAFRTAQAGINLQPRPCFTPDMTIHRTQTNPTLIYSVDAVQNTGRAMFSGYSTSYRGLSSADRQQAPRFVLCKVVLTVNTTPANGNLISVNLSNPDIINQGTDSIHLQRLVVTSNSTYNGAVHEAWFKVPCDHEGRITAQIINSGSGTWSVDCDIYEVGGVY
jgi:hypothetical protein